jgi:hypothetical protein
VDALKKFLPPAPAPLTVKWARPADDVVELLLNAAAKHAYLDPGGDGKMMFRLGGSVEGRSVQLRATPYLERGVRSRGLELAIAGEIESIEGGSRLDARVTAKVPRWADLLLAGFLVVVTINGGLTALIVSAVVLAVTVALLLPRYQRTELRNVPALARALERL